MWNVFRRRRSAAGADEVDRDRNDAPAATATELVTSHVLLPDEQIETTEHTDGTSTITTSKRRRLTVRSEGHRWHVGREIWVDDVVVATRADIRVHGNPERFAFVVLGDEVVYVNDATAIADFGARVHDGMNPLGLAELILHFHPYTSALQNLLIDPDDLRKLFGLPALPDVERFQVEQTARILTIHFTSCARYRPPGSVPMIDLYEWTVTVPVGGPARWESRMTVEGIDLA